MPTVEQYRKIAKHFDENRAREIERRERFGEVRLPNVVEFGGHRLVGVGGSIYQIDPKYEPLNFMGHHLVQTLSNDWCVQALNQTGLSAHPIGSWYRDMMEWQGQFVDAHGTVRAKLCGPAMAWFVLAYDVWVLSHFQLLAPLVERLKDVKQFQGARTELTAYALFVRAGFDLKPEDEKDKKTGHFEFTATHRKSGERVAVEAKSRHRVGVLGYTDPNRKPKENPNPGIRRIVRQALEKPHDMPFVICVDLNLPPTEDHELARHRMEQASGEVEKLTNAYHRRGKRFPATLVVLTNYPHHYGHINDIDPLGDQCVIEIAEPTHPFAGEGTHEQIVKALDSYGNLPRSWADFD